MSEEGENFGETDGSGLMPRRRRGDREPMLRMPSPLEEIRLSCLKGNITSVQRLIQEGSASVNEVFEDGWTPLMVASNGAHPQVLKFLLSEGADPNIRRADGFSALMAALTSSQREEALVQECVQILVDAGADVNVQSDLGINPLQLALKENRVQLVELLISKGANINLKDKDGRTPLFYCAERGFIEIARRLLGKGAELGNYQNGRRLSDISAAKGHLEIADLLRKAEKNRKKSPGVASVQSPLASNFSNETATDSSLENNENTQTAESPEVEESSASAQFNDDLAEPYSEVKIDLPVPPISSDVIVPQTNITPTAKPEPTEPQKYSERDKPDIPFVPINSEFNNSGTSRDSINRDLQSPVAPVMSQRPSQSTPSAQKPEKNGERSKVMIAGLVFGVAVSLLIAYFARI